jgi:hypothetical protein
MAYRLLEAAQDGRRSVTAPHPVALVRAGANFDNGVMIERPNPSGRGGRRLTQPRNLIHKS